MRRAAALLALLALPAAAHAHGGMTRAGAPIAIADRDVGPYRVSVWTAPDVGTAMLYVVYTPRGGASFVPPSAVRVGIAPASGRLTETLYDARPEQVRHGARFVAHVRFDRGEAWRVRVVTDGPTGRGELTAQVTTTNVGSPGPLGILFYATPFLLVGGLRWRVSLARRRAVRHVAALATH